jgi:hypothetical protein
MNRLHRMCRACLLLATAATAHAAAPPPHFDDVSVSAGIAHSGETYGASWGDLDGDGYPDLFVSNHRTQDSLFLNAGDGTFIDVASPPPSGVAVCPSGSTTTTTGCRTSSSRNTPATRP